HVRWAVRWPSSKSAAVAVKVTAVPGRGLAPLAGAVMVTTGPPLTVIVIDARAVLWPLSATVAVMTCVPELRALVVIVPPVPSDPSRLEVQTMTGGRVPSSGSLAVARSVTGTAWPEWAWSAGAAMVTAGGALTVIVTGAWPLLAARSVARAVR